MKRRLFTILSALSLLLCVAVLVLWVRSYRHQDRVVWSGPWDDTFVRTVSVWTLRGKLVLANRMEAVLGEDQPAGSDLRAVSMTYSSDGAWLIEDSMNTTGGGLAGFGWHPVDTEEKYRVSGYRDTGGDVLIPFWFIAGAFVVVPVLWLRRRRTPVPFGLCPSCGYDLRATPGRCPECGLFPAAPPPTSRGMSNDQCPMTKEVPMPKDQRGV